MFFTNVFYLMFFPADVYEVVSVSKLSAGEIAAIVVGILFAIAITAVIIICCFTNGKLS